MRTLWTCLWMLVLAVPAFAQGFISPVDAISPKEPSYVLRTDGSRVDGTVPMAMFMNGTLRSFTLLPADGSEKVKFKAEEVKLLANKPNTLMKLSAVADGVDSAWGLIGADWKEAMNREWVFFQQALLPGNRTKYALLQLINPGFDSRIQVYFDAEEASKDTQVMGVSVDIESYIVVKDGKQSVQVKKANYGKLYPTLFGDCAKMLEGDEGKKPKFKNFSAAVFAFDKLCGKPATP